MSLLQILSKICEKAVLNQFSSYLHQHNILSPRQSGYKRHHSTETLNVYITDNILKSMDEKKLTALVLIDLSKVLQYISHDMLLRKLEAIGVSQTALQWFKCFLTNRKQYVKTGSSKSAPLNITYGVPQGSILSPLLFSIYTNDLPSITTESSLDSYFDDSKISLSFSIQGKSEAKGVLEEDLNNCSQMVLC
jgi:retron-type reverse transcriptase